MMSRSRNEALKEATIQLLQERKAFVEEKLKESATHKIRGPTRQNSRPGGSGQNRTAVTLQMNPPCPSPD
jgi:hypothetical protein